MLVTNSNQDLHRNNLYNLAAVGALLLAAFLTLGAYGHFVAIWAQAMSEDAALARRLLLMLPGTILAGAAALNMLFSRPLWQAHSYALTATLVGNLLATLYLIYLMITGVPDHPIGVFLTLETSLLILLTALRCGLVWPVASVTSSDAVTE
ncbi:hypothetical protein HXX02_14760 [Microbulbifer elongatus]|uniref:Uncharacterized protein n=1 Tax=Microbulbifer elongatus TaxID=86173 RepID=A0ABT1P3K2_9GAMM|nr:hypothetical protein [Microbulbifer elongatus]MCQ3830698.1 hypothetical protein [Microbulbifer elongatus]